MTVIRTRAVGAGSDDVVGVDNPLAVAISGKTVIPTVLTGQGEVRNSRAIVHWITASNGHATENPLVQLNDSSDDTGADRWACYLGEIGTAPGTSIVHAKFDPPIEFVDGLFLDLSAETTVVVTIGIEQ